MEGEAASSAHKEKDQKIKNGKVLGEICNWASRREFSDFIISMVTIRGQLLWKKHRSTRPNDRAIVSAPTHSRAARVGTVTRRPLHTTVTPTAQAPPNKTKNSQANLMLVTIYSSG